MSPTGPVIDLIDPHDPAIAIWARIRYDVDIATRDGTWAGLRALCRATGPDRWMIVDFAADRFVAACGLQILVDAAEIVRGRGGRFGVAHPPSSLRRMHEIFDLGPTLPLLDGDDVARILRRRCRGAGTAG